MVKNIIWCIVIGIVVLIGIAMAVVTPCEWFRYASVPGRCVKYFAQ